MRSLILGLCVLLSACSTTKVENCRPVPMWILEMPPAPSADHLVPGESTRKDVAKVIGRIEEDRRLARDKLKAAITHQAPCR